MNTPFFFENLTKDLENYQRAVDAHSIVAITDARGVITHVNDKFCDISQYSYAELMGGTHKIINSGYHSRLFFKKLWKTIASGNIWQGEICNRAKDGSVYWVDTTIVPLTDSAGSLKYYISIRTDITQLKNAEAQARYMALHDELTGLPNRHFMKEYLAAVIESNGLNQAYGALLMLDLDHFKNINDAFGHDVGDDLLKVLSIRLSQHIHPKNVVVRLGGDEFLIILSELSSIEEDARREVRDIAEYIHKECSRPFLLNGKLTHTSVSMGIAMFCNNTLQAHELLKHADMALYEVKRMGRNDILFFDASIEQRILVEQSLLSDFRLALKRNELQLFYQVLVDAEQNIKGYEALLRWQHPVHGLMLPERFMHLIEKTELIHTVGYQVLELACQQLLAWHQQDEASHWVIAVNVSAEQFKNHHFEKNVVEIIEKYAVNPALLRFELTESMFYADLNQSIKTMQTLIEFGIQFSMDDFGTGYSSLSYLRLLPLDQLKIDRSFMAGMLSNPEDLAVIKTIIALAKILGLTVVAEGIESEAQFLLLKESGCYLFQGYYFGYPSKF